MPIFLNPTRDVKNFATISNRKTVYARRQDRVTFPRGICDELLLVHSSPRIAHADACMIIKWRLCGCISFTQRLGLQRETHMPLHGVFKAAMNGISVRGNGGFVYVKGDSCAYMFPDELVGQEDIKRKLSTLLSNSEANRMFFVAEVQDGKFNLKAYERTQVLADFRAEQANGTQRVDHGDAEQEARIQEL